MIEGLKETLVLYKWSLTSFAKDCFQVATEGNLLLKIFELRSFQHKDFHEEGTLQSAPLLL